MLLSDVSIIKCLDGKSDEQSKKTISIMVVDDHPVVRFGVVSLLSLHPDIKVIGEAGSCADMCVLLEHKRPEVLLLDLDLGDVCGPGVLEKVREKYPNQKVIIYSSYGTEACVTDTVRIGIHGYVLKGSSIEKLREAIRVVAQGELYMDPVLTCMVMAYTRRQPKNARSNWGELTSRERSVIHLVASGKRNKEIAKELYISQRTVRYHISSMFKKLRVSNRTELSNVANSKGLIVHTDKSKT